MRNQVTRFGTVGMAMGHGESINVVMLDECVARQEEIQE
jgi:hypothetical protein